MVELSKPLTYLINRCLEKSIFPSSEKIARISPIYKSSEHNLLTNYRPISILPVLSKVFELIVHEQLYTYLENNNLLSNVQFGFRRNRSTQHAVTLLSDHIRTSTDNQMYTGVVFLDLSKAFDTVDHGCLLSKLSAHGIENYELRWFENYLFNRKQYVTYQACQSEYQTVNTGVPQGSILGPLLFILLMNDIESSLLKCQILLYADDTVIYFSDKNIEQIQKILNEDISNINRWFIDNYLSINLKKGKTEFVLFGSSKRLTKANDVVISINDVPITQTSEYEYLGITFDPTLSFTKHFDLIYKKISSRIKLLNRIRSDISPYVAESIFRMTIAPIFYYCSNIFIGNTMSRLQLLQNRAYQISFKGKNVNTWSTVVSERNRRCVTDVFKSINGLSPINFNNYFNKMIHECNTRGNGASLRLPKVKTETGRRTFMFQGALCFNKLPFHLQHEISLVQFKTKLKKNVLNNINLV